MRMAVVGKERDCLQAPEQPFLERSAKAQERQRVP